MKHKFNKLLWVVIIFLFWVWLFKFGPLDVLSHHIQTIYRDVFKAQIAPREEDFETPKLKILQNEKHGSCDDEMPAHGSKFKISANNNGSKLKSRVQLTNGHLFPALLTFKDISEQQPYGAVFLHPNQSTQLSLPIGQYTIGLATGEIWCNAKQGFKNGAVINPEQNLTIKQNQVANIRLLSFGAYAEDVMVSLTSSLGLVATGSGQSIEGTGSLLLHIYGQNFWVEGTINQLPVYFLVDTGAADVGISESFAKQLGISDCKVSKRSTANGIVEVCEATVSELTFGQFKLKNVKVTYNKGMPNDYYVLGMNVISLFNLEQQGDVMRLSRQ